MRVAILYDAGSDEWSPQDVAAVVGNVHEVRDVLRRRGHEVELLPVRLGDFRWLNRVRRADLVFNLCEGVNGHARFEDYVVGTLELAGVPFTGCRHWAITVAHRKHVANTLLAAAGVPVPAFTLAQANKVPSDFPLPAIVKPAAEDASVGIDNGAVCTSKRALKKRVALMLEQFEEVLVQEYVPGREFNVGFVGKRMLPIAEIRFDGMPEGTWPIVGYAAKWIPGSPEDEGTLPVCPAEVPEELETSITKVAREAWMYVSGGEGYGRVDLRVNGDGRAVRARGESLPRPLQQRGAGPHGAGVRLELRRPRDAHRGRGAHALPEPHRRRGPRQRGVGRVSGTLTAPALRPLTAADRRRIEEITRAVRVFRDDEVPVALEVFDGAVARLSRLHRPGRHGRRAPGGVDLLGTDPLHPRHLRSLLDGGGPSGARPPGSAPPSCGKWKAGWPGLRGSSSWRRPGDPTTGQPAPSTRPVAIGRRPSSPISTPPATIRSCT